MKIIVDVMSGDNAPYEILAGVYDASLEYDAEFTIVGDENLIKEIAAQKGYNIEKFNIIHTDTVIDMTDDPLSIMRAKSDSSMGVGLKLLSDGEGDAFVSAGNTGALFTGATLIVRKIKGIQRAAIASLLPFTPPVLLLDSGANITVNDEALEQFAAMGSAYMKNMFSIEAPRVGLLNNGEEEIKGTALQLAAYKRLSEASDINFVGNIEGNKVAFDSCDVLVTDGFTGNILLKSVEGMGKLMIDVLKGMFKQNGMTMLSAVMVKKQLSQIKKNFSASEYGGAPILGISKPVIKAHGSSDARAIKNAIRQAIGFVNSGVNYDIAEQAAIFAERKKAEIARKREECRTSENSD